MKLKMSRLLLGVAAGMALLAGPGAPAGADEAPGTYVEVTFSDSDLASSNGPGPQAVTESDRFVLINGGAGWLQDEAPVEYLVIDEPSRAAARAVEHAVATLDGFITTRSFSRVSKSSQINPCTGQPNTVSWRSGDGPGGALAIAGVCVNTQAQAIVGFRIAFDLFDTWATDGDPESFDVQNVAAHEAGHMAGLGHVNAPRDGCLSMYTFSARGETQKRTLGWGDKLGLDRIYGSGDITPGQCGS
jgi:hypothetical protein